MAKSIVMPDETIINKIYLIRGHKVMLDNDLAELYGTETRRLNEQVSRNIERFPEDFMFSLTKEEFKNLKSQNATSSWGGRRTPPNVFTEHGVLMLSSVLNSSRAIQVNIHIMRIYSRLREMLLTHKDILLKIEQIEKKVTGQEYEIQMIFSAIKELLDPTQGPRKKIGFKSSDKK